MAVALGRPQCTTERCAIKRSTYEAWFALNRRAYQTILNMAIQAEMNMTSAEAMARRRARLDDVISGRELAAGLTSSVEQSMSSRGTDMRCSPSNGITPDSTRDPAVTSYTDDVITLSFTRHPPDPDSSKHIGDVISGTTQADDAGWATPATETSARSPWVPLADDEKSTEMEDSADGEIVWTPIDKRALVTLVDQLTTGNRLPSDRRTAGDELHEPDLCRLTTSGVGPEMQHVSTAERKSGGMNGDERTRSLLRILPTVDDGNSASFPVQDRQRPLKDLSNCEEVLSENSLAEIRNPRPEVAKLETGSARKPTPAKVKRELTTGNGADSRSTSGESAEYPVKMAHREKGSQEIWMSVDKSLVDDLFDQLLQSFDDVNVAETDLTGSEESRDAPTANQRSSSTDSWSSAAYKWKSHLLLRMNSQDVTTTTRSLCRKRRHADRKLI